MAHLIRLIDFDLLSARNLEWVRGKLLCLEIKKATIFRSFQK